ncbi:methylamine dehydrogenase accessory protein MauD [Paracoccus sp. DMF-8]|uniref:methylamine dehydrogenase accessory protein MauD n=1 Tax=Paracoccus sp. DMF-8 TaxID=3019445 RepID=UPI0023E444E9|nr:methylamine dehydrogenase accessory protein MauD [Paracoccus sp. DMF-8]MDF3608025.1 methylamine dehydrogenase accessory protein MauD [Paracoccus sp. DMF-8]
MQEVLHEPLVTQGLRGFLALLFVTAAVSKLTSLEEFYGVVRNFRLLPDGLSKAVAFVLPVAELAIAAGLLITPLVMPAARAAAALLTVFGTAIAINVLRGRTQIDCGCFRNGMKPDISWALVGRNIVLTGLALALVGLFPATAAGSLADIFVGLMAGLVMMLLYFSASMLGGLTARQTQLPCRKVAEMTFLIASNILLWVAFLGVTLVLLGLIRQVGLLHERSSPMGAMITDHGPDIGDNAPEFDIPDYFGRNVRIGGASDQGRPTLIMFTAPTCPVCDKLFPIIKSIAKAEKIGVVMISDGAPEEHARFLKNHELGQIRYVVSAEIGMAFQVGKIPYGVLLDAEGVIKAKGLTNTREHLESLLEADKSGFASLQQFMASRKKSAA